MPLVRKNEDNAGTFEPVERVYKAHGGVWAVSPGRVREAMEGSEDPRKAHVRVFAEGSPDLLVKEYGLQDALAVVSTFGAALERSGDFDRDTGGWWFGEECWDGAGEKPCERVYRELEGRVRGGSIPDKARRVFEECRRTFAGVLKREEVRIVTAKRRGVWTEGGGDLNVGRMLSGNAQPWRTTRRGSKRRAFRVVIGASVVYNTDPEDIWRVVSMGACAYDALVRAGHRAEIGVMSFTNPMHCPEGKDAKKLRSVAGGVYVKLSRGFVRLPAEALLRWAGPGVSRGVLMGLRGAMPGAAGTFGFSNGSVIAPDEDMKRAMGVDLYIGADGYKTSAEGMAVNVAEILKKRAQQQTEQKEVAR